MCKLVCTILKLVRTNLYLCKISTHYFVLEVNIICDKYYSEH